MNRSILAAVLLAAVAAVAAEKKPSAEEAVRQTLAAYRQAMEARDVEKLAAVLAEDVVVVEGVHKNVGWVDYRDNHIGPEMKEWKSFRFTEPKIGHVSVAGDRAAALQEGGVVIELVEKTVTLRTAETFMLRREGDKWKIAHIHMSASKK